MRIQFSVLMATALLMVACKNNVPATAIENTARTVNKEVASNDSNILPSKDIPIRQIGLYPQLFNDSNAVHIDVAERIGTVPLISHEGAQWKRMFSLVEVKSNDNFMLDTLKYSAPYLVREAYSLINSIGKAFADTLRARGAEQYRIIVTSVLRTDDLVKRLRRGNSNASENSAHRYGTTFDITYLRFYDVKHNSIVRDNVALKHILAEVMLDMKNRNKCYVKYERKQSCFHITAR